VILLIYPYNFIVVFVRSFMKEYYEELINIGTNIIDLIEEKENIGPSEDVEVNAIFLSLESISTICEYISTDSYDFDNDIKTTITK